MYMIGLAFFLTGAPIAAGDIVLGWKMACNAHEQYEKKNPKSPQPVFQSGLPGQSVIDI